MKSLFKTMLGLALMFILSISLIGASDVPSDDDVGRISFSDQVTADQALVDVDLQAVSVNDYRYKTDNRESTAISYYSDQTDTRIDHPTPKYADRKARDGLSYMQNIGLLATTSKNYFKTARDKILCQVIKHRRARDGINAESVKLTSFKQTFALG